MTNAVKLLDALDVRLDSPVELTLYGRAALHLGFANPPAEYALSRDIDAVLWLGQAEDMAERGNFWESVEEVNRLFADQELYVSHFFEETQVVLTPEWRSKRVPIQGQWKQLRVFRLGDEDLFLSKLMRDDPIDRGDALYIAKAAHFSESRIRDLIQAARVPDIPEIKEQFRICSARILKGYP
jgi:hypothetical protein